MSESNGGKAQRMKGFFTSVMRIQTQFFVFFNLTSDLGPVE